MKDSNHIEDLFRDKLSGFEQQPASKGWDSMQTALDNMRLEHLAKVKLANQALTPAKSVWHKLATKLWWKQFTHFSAIKFNIYYAGVAVAGITTGVIVSNQQKTEIYIPQNQQKVSELVQYEAYQPIETLELSPIDFSLLSTNQNLDGQTLRNTNINDPQNVETAWTNTTRDEKQEQVRLTNPNADQQRMQITFNSEIKTVEKAEKENTTEQIIEEKEESIRTIPVLMNLYLPRILFVNEKNLMAYQQRPDTLGMNYKGEPIVKNLNFFEQGWYGGIIYFQQDFEFMDPEAGEAYLDNKNYSQFSYRFGVRFNMVRKNFIMQSGLYFANLNNQFNHTQKHLVIHDDTPHLPFLEYEWPYKSDTLVQYTTHVYNNSYSYIELPVLFGWHLENEKFACNLKTGPLFNMLSGVNAMLVLNSDNKISSVQLRDFKRPGIRWEISADLIYRFNNKFSVFIEPSYVYDITTMLNKDYEIKSRFKGFSGGLGFYYRF